jgi:hypothetical protein
MKKLLNLVLGLLMFVGMSGISEASLFDDMPVFSPENSRNVEVKTCWEKIAKQGAHLLFSEQVRPPVSPMWTSFHERKYYLLANSVFVLETRKKQKPDESYPSIELTCYKWNKKG